MTTTTAIKRVFVFRQGFFEYSQKNTEIIHFSVDGKVTACGLMALKDIPFDRKGFDVTKNPSFTTCKDCKKCFLGDKHVLNFLNMAFPDFVERCKRQKD